MFILILIILIITILILIQKKRIEILGFLRKNKFIIILVTFLFFIINLNLKNTNLLKVFANDKKIDLNKVKNDRINFIKNTVRRRSYYFNHDDHDFSLKKTNALNVLLDFQISHLNDFDLQYLQMRGCHEFVKDFDYNISTTLDDSGEYGAALQQCSLIIEDVFKEMSNTPGLARRKQMAIDQMRFYEGEVIFRKLPDEVFDNQAKMITDEKLNVEIFEECGVVVRNFFCFKYSHKELAGDQYQFEHDPIFRKEIEKVVRKFLSEHQEFK